MTTSAPSKIKGSVYLAFLASPAFWNKAIHAEGVTLIVDGYQLDQANITPDTIAKDSAVTILTGDVFDGFERLHTLDEHFENWTFKCVELAVLKRRGNEYNASLRERGHTLLSYVVPCCGATQESRVGPPVGQWDTLATCPDCGSMYMKISTATTITALMPETENA